MIKIKMLVASLPFIILGSTGLKTTQNQVNAEGTVSTFEYGTFYNNETIFSTFSTNWKSLENQDFCINSNSNVTWKINKARRAWGNKLQLISYDPEGTTGEAEAKEHSFTNTTSYPAGTDEYDIAQAALTSEELANENTLLNGLYTMNYVSNLESIYASWEAGDAYYGFVRVLYKLEESSSWQLLIFDNGENTRNLSKGENELLCTGSKFEALKGKSARFAIVHLSFWYTHVSFIMKNILINQTNSVADFIGVLSAKENTCEIVKDTTTFYGDTFNFLTNNLSDVDKTVLANYAISSPYSSETNALGLLNIYLKYVGKSILNTNFIIKDDVSNNWFIALIAISTTVIILITTIYLFGKKKVTC